MYKKKVLIIGGTGFIGYHLAKKLIKNYQIFSLSINKPNNNRKLKKVKYILCDISNYKVLKKKLNFNIDIIVNLGGYINHRNKKLAQKTHFTGLKNLVNIFSNKKIKNFIQIGSSSEYGKCKAPHFETFFCKPKTTYGISKFLASKYLLKIDPRNFPYTILRFYQVYGPNQKFDRIIPMITRFCLKNREFACSSGKQNRDFLYVTDAVNAIYKCFEKKKVIGEIINVGAGKQFNIKKLILKIKNTINKGTPKFGLIKMREDEPISSFPDIQKAKKLLNWKPKAKFSSALLKTINYYRATIN